MPKRITLFFVITFILSVASLSAQSRRVVTYHSTTINNGRVDVQAFVYESVDVQPQFPGGDREMIKYINRERKYPEEAYKSGVYGRVLCGFVVTPSGEITNAEVLRGVEESLNQEALRVIENMPKWDAGLVDGVKVPVYCILAIPFRR